MDEIKTLFFDLGNVLVFFDLEKMARQIASTLSIQLDPVKSFIETHLDAYERGTLSSSELHSKLCDLSGKNIPWEQTERALCDIFKPNTEMVPIIQELKKQNKKLLILSNTCAAHFEFLYKTYPILQLFDGYILSYQVGARKPEKKIFETALQHAEGPAFYTDDISEYVEAARSLSIDAEVFTTASKLALDLKKRQIL